jgi:hypothetical protein
MSSLNVRTVIGEWTAEESSDDADVICSNVMFQGGCLRVFDHELPFLEFPIKVLFRL